MNILLLEDEPNDAELIKNSLIRSGIDCNITYVADKQEFIAAIDSDTYDAILSDNSLPQFSAVQALKIVNCKWQIQLQNFWQIRMQRKWQQGMQNIPNQRGARPPLVGK